MKDLVLRTRWLLSALLLTGAALFAIGVATERNSDDHHAEATSAHIESGAEGAKEEAAEQDEQAGTAAEERDEQAEEERLLRLDLESVPLVVAGVVVSVALAVDVWLRRDRWLLWTAGGFAAVFAVLDVAELVHQIEENRTGIAIIAAIVAIMHAAGAAVAETRASNEPAAS
jgi:hypothetical protein